MRISDWSSDVCSSDLLSRWPNCCHETVVADRNAGACGMRQLPIVGGRCDSGRKYTCTGVAHRDHRTRHGGFQEKSRSEEHTSELQSLMRMSYAVFCLKHNKLRMMSGDLPRKTIN